MKPASEKQNNYYKYNNQTYNTSLEMYIRKHVKLTER